MKKEQLVKFCILNDDCVETYPFKDKLYADYAVIRHKSNNKWYGLIFYLEDKLCINLKCNPVEGAFLRDNYPFISPAWHMNKAHWVLVEVEKCPIDLLKTLIEKSFELTSKKSKKQKLHDSESEDF